MNENQTPPDSIDWGRFKQMFGAGFPFNRSPEWNEFNFGADPFQDDPAFLSAQAIRDTVRETPRFIHVKLTFPPKYRNPELWRIFAGRQSIAVRDSKGQAVKTVRLPSPVYRTKYRAVFADGSLSIRLRKVFMDDREKELFVEY